ncbi:MAG TPA: alpha/beta fold hydrolase [Streptosporangiaceae bacterium]
MLSEEQRELLTARLRRAQTGGKAGIVRRAPEVTELPLSFAQEQLWFMDRFAPGLPTYNIPVALWLRGPLDAGALGRAVDALVARHETLRTRLVPDGEGRPFQVVDEPAPVDLNPLELSEPGLRELAADAAARPFSLADGPLFRARLVRLAAATHVLVVVVHHVVFDGWSIGVLVRDLMALYAAEVTGGPPELEELPVQYGDYALWERERLDGAAAAELAEYWRKNLDGFRTLALPTDRPRPIVAGYEGGLERLRLGGELLAGLRELSRRAGATLFATLMAGLQALLHRYTGQDDIVVGTVSANRGRATLAPLIGFLVNTLAIRTDLSGDPAFVELLDRVRAATVGAYAHQDLPFAKLVEELQVDRDPSRAPIFQVALSFAEAPDDVHAAGLTVRVENLDLLAAKFDLNFFAEVREDGLWVDVSYATGLFDAGTVRRMLGHLRVLLEGAAADPTRRLSRLPVLTEAELRRELVEWDAHVLDAHLNPVPVGVAGELHIGAAGVPCGYPTRPATEQRSVPDPFRPGCRLYKTGDLVKRRPDGDLVFLGRLDGTGGGTGGSSGTAQQPVPAPAAQGKAYAAQGTAYAAPRTPVETALAGTYARILGHERVGIDDGFFDLGGNSLQAMRLITLIDDQLSVDLPITAVFLAPTVRRLAARIEQARGATARPRGPLVELTEETGAAPLFVVHAVGGTVYAYAPLASELAGSFTVYGVEAAGLGEGTAPAESLDAMASTYAEAIRAAQPEGPYRIAGWSMGGLVAYEIARRLEAGGERVAFLGLLDAPFDLSGGPPAGEDRLAAGFVADAARTLGWAESGPAAAAAGAAERLDWLARRLDGGDPGSVRAEIDRRFAVFRAHTRAIAGYAPTGEVRAATLVVGARRSPNAEAAGRWASFLGGSVAMMSIDSDHYAFLRPPLVREVGAAIGERAS